MTCLSLNCINKFMYSFSKIWRQNFMKKITFFNISKCLGVPAFWRQNLRCSWGLNFYIWPGAYWRTILKLCYQNRLLTHQEVPEARVMWNVPCILRRVRSLARVVCVQLYDAAAKPVYAAWWLPCSCVRFTWLSAPMKLRMNKEFCRRLNSWNVKWWCRNKILRQSLLTIKVR